MKSIIVRLPQIMTNNRHDAIIHLNLSLHHLLYSSRFGAADIVILEESVFDPHKLLVRKDAHCPISNATEPVAGHPVII